MENKINKKNLHWKYDVNKNGDRTIADKNLEWLIISGDITVRNLLSLGFKFGLVKENRLVIGSHMVRLEESVKKAGIFVNSIKVETETLLKFVNETLFITVMNYFGLSLVRDRSISSVFVDIYQEQRDLGKRTSLKAISRITEFLAQLPKDTLDYLKGIKIHANEIGGKYGGKESELRREYLYGLWKEFKKDRNY